MQNWKPVLVAILIFAMVSAGVPLAPVYAATDSRVTPSAPATPVPAATVGAPAWPKVIDRDGNHVILYQPQLNRGRSTARWWRTRRSR